MTTFTMPAHYRTWQFQKNQAIAVQASLALTNGRGLRLIKNSLTGTGSWTDKDGYSTTATGNWTVVSCSNGAGSFGNNDNTDRWSIDTDVVWAAAGVNHSWIVLRQTGINGTYYLCIDCNTISGSDSSRISYAWSKNIFTGGTASARPTSSNEVIHADFPLASSRNWGGPNSNVASVYHVQKSNDGKGTRVIISRNGFATGLWFFEELEYAPPGDLYPAAAHIYGDQAGAPVASSLIQNNFASSTSSVSVTQRNGSYPAFCRNHLVYYANNSLVTVPTVQNDMASAWPMYRFGVYSGYNQSISATSPNENTRGEVGIVRDMWWVQSQLSEGDFAPASGERTYVILGDLCLPNDAGTITLA